MSRMVIDFDGEAFAEVARHLGATTRKETVNAALHETLGRRRRAVALEEMRQMVADGEIDLSILEREPGGDSESGERSAARSQ